MSAISDLVKSTSATTTTPKPSGSAISSLLKEPRVLPKPVEQAPAPVVEQPKTKLQQAGAVAKGLGVSIAKPFVKSYELLTQGAKAYGQVLKAYNANDKATQASILNTEAKRLATERAKPIEFGGQQINRINSAKDVVGTALEIGSYAIGGGEALAAKNILKQTLTEGLKVGAKQVGKRLAIGGAAMSAYSAGAAMQEDKTAKQIATEAVKGFGIGAAFEVGMLGLGVGGALAARKFQNILRGVNPASVEEKLAARTGEELIPAKIKVGEEIKNAGDNKISYQKELSLGKDAKGEPILSRTEINPKTGEAKIFIDKSLDKTPGRKALIIEKAHDDIVNARLVPTAAEGKTVLNKSLEDFGLRIGKTKEEVGVALQKESAQFGGLQGAIKKYSENPAVVTEKAPTVAKLLEHQTNPNVNILTTSQDDLAQATLKNVQEKLNKIEVPKVEGVTKPAKAAQRLEAEVVERDLVKSIPDLPQREVNHIADQATEYAKLATNRELSERVAMGLENAPGKLKASYVWVQEANKAAREGNIEMIQKLAQSKVALEGSEAGSFIRMFREMDHANPVSVIKKVNADKAKKFVDTGKVRKTTEELKNVVKKSGPSKESWASFIESIKC